MDTDIKTEDLRERWLRLAIWSLVDNEQAVSVETIRLPTVTGLAYKVKVDQSDIGKVIGKQGHTARALRTLLNAGAKKLGCRFELHIEAL